MYFFQLGAYINMIVSDETHIPEPYDVTSPQKKVSNH